MVRIPSLPDIPTWLPSTKPTWWSTAEDFLQNPEREVKNIVYGMLLAGIGWFFDPIFRTIELLFVGSDPGTLGGKNEMWGLADFPVAFARILGNAFGVPLESLLGVPATIIDAVTVDIPGPFDAIVVALVVGGMFYVAARYGPIVLRAALEAIPVIGGPLSTLLGGFD